MERIETKKAPSAVGAYSQAIVSNGFVFVSGQIPVSAETGEVVSGGIAEQTEQVCKNLSAILVASGSSLKKVVKTTCYLADISDFKAFNGVYATFFVGRPARACVAVKDLPKGVLVEIDAIAEK